MNCHYWHIHIENTYSGGTIAGTVLFLVILWGIEITSSQNFLWCFSPVNVCCLEQICEMNRPVLLQLYGVSSFDRHLVGFGLPSRSLHQSRDCQLWIVHHHLSSSSCDVSIKYTWNLLSLCGDWQPWESFSLVSLVYCRHRIQTASVSQSRPNLSSTIFNVSCHSVTTVFQYCHDYFHSVRLLWSSGAHAHPNEGPPTITCKSTHTHTNRPRGQFLLCWPPDFQASFLPF